MVDHNHRNPSAPLTEGLVLELPMSAANGHLLGGSCFNGRALATGMVTVRYQLCLCPTLNNALIDTANPLGIDVEALGDLDHLKTKQNQ